MYLNAILIVSLIFLMSRKMARLTAVQRKYSAEDAPKGLESVLRNFGRETAQQVEKIFRLETRHFKSEQFVNTGSAGMVAVKTGFPFGWGSLLRFMGSDLAKGDKTGFWKYKMLVGQKYWEYIGFPTIEDSMNFVAQTITDRGRAGAWYSTRPESQDGYEEKLSKIRTPIVDGFRN